MASESQFSID